jgi:hypothetical protein
MNDHATGLSEIVSDPDMVGDNRSDIILFCIGNTSSGIKVMREHPSFLAFLRSWKDRIPPNHWMLIFSS